MLVELQQIKHQRGLEGLLPQNLPFEILEEFVLKLISFQDAQIFNFHPLDERGFISSPLIGELNKTIDFLKVEFPDQRNPLDRSFNQYFKSLLHNYGMVYMFRSHGKKLIDPPKEYDILNLSF